MQHFINAFQLYGVFSGRSTREEYWMFTLIYLLVYLALSIVSFFLNSSFFDISFSVLTLGVIVPNFSITTRRLHDIGRSGWWQAAPYIGMVFVFIGVFQASSILMIGGSIFMFALFIMLMVFLVSPSDDDNTHGCKPTS